MTGARLGADDWARVNDLFHRALALPPAERAALVQRECAGADAVRDEVVALLAAHERADRFLAQPAASSVARPETAGSAANRAGQHVGQYRIERVLGEGGMGVVYLASDQRLGRQVALKSISPAVTTDPARRERLRREARAAAALTHPGIATVYALEEFGDDIFIAGEFVAGETLRDEVARGPQDADRVLTSAIELSHALAAAHDRGVVHRDLKPENIIRTPAGHLKILDFGLARMRDLPAELAHLTDDGKVFGTPGYMSPEQIRRGQVDARSDLFSLGILLHELLNGAHPFAGANSAETIARILEAEPSGPGSSGSRPHDTSSLGHRLNSLVRVLLRKEPAERFGSAHDLLAALERVRAGERPPDPAEARLSRADAQRWWRFHQMATSVAYALLLVPVGLAGSWLGDQRLGVVLFLAALAAAVAAVTIRMHLVFASASMPDQRAAQMARSRLGLRAADLGFVGALEAAGLAVLSQHNVWASILVGAGVLVLLSATIIEPATARAAFDEP